MVKFVIVLALAIYGKAIQDAQNTAAVTSVEFTEKAIDFESGQPVFPKGTSVIVRDLPTSKSRVVINETVDLIVNENQVDVSSLLDLTEGTYTVMIASENGNDETFGFTIK